jgi:hypothetical protein
MGLTQFVLSALGVVAARLIFDELKDWLPTLTERLIDIAVTKLPEHLRERYREEWRAGVSDTPGTIGKLVHAAGLILATPGMQSAPPATSETPAESAAPSEPQFPPGGMGRTDGASMKVVLAWHRQREHFIPGAVMHRYYLTAAHHGRDPAQDGDAAPPSP